MSDEINKKINSVLKEISKAYGDGSAMIMDENRTLDIQRISSGSLNLDLALGNGMPLGRNIELYGPESSGKTTVAILHAIEMQKAFPDLYILFVDIEHAVDPKLFESYGLDLGRTIIVQPDTAEEALDILEVFVRSDTVSLAIVDSVSALVPNEEAVKTMADQQMGLVARLMGKALRKLTPSASEHNVEVIWVNQVREKIGGFSPFGPSETTSGGRALKFFASVRINVKAGERIKDPKNKDNIIGHQINVNITKNKTAMPYKKASFDLYYGIGVDKLKEVADIAVLVGYVKRAGAYYQIKDEEGNKVKRAFNGEEIELSFQGQDSLVSHLREDTELYNILQESILTNTTPTLQQLQGELPEEVIQEEV